MTIFVLETRVFQSGRTFTEHVVIMLYLGILHRASNYVGLLPSTIVRAKRTLIVVQYALGKTMCLLLIEHNIIHVTVNVHNFRAL